jgi:membrane-associated protein
MDLIDLFLHLDRHLEAVAGSFGLWLYLLLFAIIFCETGLVVTPFLPGDSLLFATGALVANPILGAHLDLTLLAILLIAAAILGDAVNYSIGYRVGPRIFSRETSRLLNKRHLLRTQEFYIRHGGKTIVLARFIPIIRTFAPFVAGIGKMPYRRFAVFNVSGAIIWILSFLLGGYFFGNLPFVKENFSVVILAIIIISVMPLAIEYLRSRRQKAAVGAAAAGLPQREDRARTSEVP